MLGTVIAKIREYKDSIEKEKNYGDSDEIYYGYEI